MSVALLLVAILVTCFESSSQEPTLEIVQPQKCRDGEREINGECLEVKSSPVQDVEDAFGAFAESAEDTFSSISDFFG